MQQNCGPVIWPSYSRKSLFQRSVQQLVFLCVAETKEDPEFTEQIENITVPAGRNVKLACSVKNLGTYKVRSPLNTNDTHLLAVRVHVQIRITFSELREYDKIRGITSSRIIYRVDLAMDASLNGVKAHIPENLNIQQYNCNELKCITAKSIWPFTIGLHEKQAPLTKDIGMKKILWKVWKVMLYIFYF